MSFSAVPFGLSSKISFVTKELSTGFTCYVAMFDQKA